MKPIGMHNYFVYITTNINKNVLYTGVTNDLQVRLYQHLQDSLENKTTFAGKYNCVHLVYYERFEFVEHAIEREKQIKGWKRAKKENLIKEFNANWNFLNKEAEDL